MAKPFIKRRGSKVTIDLDAADQVVRTGKGLAKVIARHVAEAARNAEADLKEIMNEAKREGTPKPRRRKSAPRTVRSLPKPPTGSES